MKPYLIPTKTNRTFTEVSKSRFITSIGLAASTEQAKEFLNQIRAEMPDATHHVYAFRVGYGHSTIEGMSDAGEPTGTAGPPILAVIRGTHIGDVIVVVTRYFGGIKLGTGGLVRAYTKAARAGLNELKMEEKVVKKLIGIDTSYSFYETVKHLIHKYNGLIQDENFQQSVALFVEFREDEVAGFSRQLLDATSGQVMPIILNDD